jgi:hypothetical protein
VLVLATGAVETPRLLLAHRSARQPNGIGNSSGLVGQFFLDTLLAEITVRFDDRIDAYKGPPIDSRVWNFSRQFFVRATEARKEESIQKVSNPVGATTVIWLMFEGLVFESRRRRDSGADGTVRTTR